MKVLITGACGWLSRRLIDELAARGHELRLLDYCAPEEATIFVPGSYERQRLPLQSKWPFVRADITDAAAMQKAVEGMDAVIHLAAAVTGVPEQGVKTFHVNACGTYVILDACRLAGVKRFLCASSINAFGTIYWRLSGQPPVYSKMPLDEDFPPVPEDAYSLSKHVNELTCAAFTRAFGITTAAFRFAGVWNESGYEDAIKKGLQPTTGWSDDLYQWVHRWDLCAGIRQALECPTLPMHGVYTLSAADTRCPEPTMELLRKFRPDLAATVNPAQLPGRAPLMSIRKAQQAFGYAPEHRLAK